MDPTGFLIAMENFPVNMPSASAESVVPLGTTRLLDTNTLKNLWSGAGLAS